MCTIDAVNGDIPTGAFKHPGRRRNVQYLISSAAQTKSLSGDCVHQRVRKDRGDQ